MDFYVCPKCGNVISLINGDEKFIRCCGVEMEKLIPNSTEAAEEKHIPIYEKIGDKIEVSVGSVSHPMESEHYISFVAFSYDNRLELVRFNSTDSSSAKFDYVSGAKVYAYCNKHGLWMNTVD